MSEDGGAVQAECARRVASSSDRADRVCATSSQSRTDLKSPSAFRCFESSHAGGTNKAGVIDLRLVALMESIAPSSAVTGPLTNMTYEFRSLVCWFLSVRDRVHRYATWRPVEKMFMKRLFDNEVKFNPTAARDAINLEYHRIDLDETNRPTFESSGGSFHRAYTQPNPYPARTDPTQPPFNRGRDYDDRRQRYEHRDQGPPRRDAYTSFRDNQRDNGYDQERRRRRRDSPPPRRRDDSPPRRGRQDDRNHSFRNEQFCFICAGPHSTFNHDPKKTKFSDNERHVSALIPGHPPRLVKADDHDVNICIKYNAGTCTETGDHDGRLHVCALDLGSHTAISRNHECKRITAGALCP